MMKRPLSVLVCATAVAALGACSTTRNYSYSPAPSGVVTEPATYPLPANYAEVGTVRSIDVMPVASRTTGGGAVLGAVIGGVLGNQVGAGTGRAAATVAGAGAGGVAGNAIERHQRRDDEVFHIGVRFDDGSFREFDYLRIDDLQVGDRVKWENGQLVRM